MRKVGEMINTNEIPNAEYVDISAPRCPRCGCTLISNGTDIWCSNVQPACSFGLDYDVHVDGLAAAVEHERSQKSAVAGVPVFGHTQVDEAFRLWRDMSRQERRVLAGKLAEHDAPGADQYAMMIFDAVYDTGYHDAVMTAPDPGSERYKRIWHIIQSDMTVVDDEQADDWEPSAAIWEKELTPIKAKIVGTIERPDFSVDYDDYDALTASAQ